MVHPIIDEYYNYNPYHRRSSKFVQDKGLITNEKQPGRASTANSPSVIPSLDITLPTTKKPFSPISRDLHQSIASNHVSSIPSRAKSPSANGMNGSLAPDIRSLSSIPQHLPRDREMERSGKPQELGNTKKKRAPTKEEEQREQAMDRDVESPARTAYGDPLKIAQYFPELN